MPIVHTKVAIIPSSYAVTCSIIAGGYCTGQGEHICTFSEQPQSGGVPHDFNQQVWSSEDDGITWAKTEELVTPRLWLCPPGRSLTSPQVNFVGATVTAPFTSNGIDDFVSRSQNQGETWLSGVSGLALAGLSFGQVFGFATLPNAHIVAIGRVVSTGGTVYHTLRSVNGGINFVPFGNVAGLAPPGAVDLQGLVRVVVMGTRLWAHPRAAGTFADLYYSDDEGLTWSPVPTPLPDPSAQGVGVTALAVQDGKLLVGGGRTPTGAPDNRTEPVVWATADQGATWTATVIPGYPFVDDPIARYFVHGLVAMGSHHLFAVVSSDPDYPGGPKPFAISRDNGQNWTTDGIYEQAPGSGLGTAFNGWQTDDGEVMNVITRGANGEFAGGHAEVWRSVVDAYSGTGSCVASVTSPDGEPLPTGPCQTPFRRRLGVCVDDLTDDDIIRGRWQAGDRLVINRVIFSIDWDHLTQQFTKHVIYTFDQSVKKYGLRPAMRIESKGIRSAPTACGGFGTVGCALAMLDERAFNLGARFADPPPMLNLDVFYRKYTWEPSDIICVTSAFVPNTIAGRRGIDHEAFEIINIQQSFAPEGRVTLTLLDVEAITLPEPPGRIVVEDDEDLQAVLRGERVAMSELPIRLSEVRRQRRIIADWRRGKTQDPVASGGASIDFDPRGFFPGTP